MKKLNLVQVLQLLGRAKRQMNANPGWRFGQSLFNALFELYPSLANFIRGADYDPFYDDGRIGLFISKIYET